MKKQLIIVLLCALGFAPGVYAMFGKFDPINKADTSALRTTSFRGNVPASTVPQSAVSARTSAAIRPPTRQVGPRQVTPATTTSRVQPRHTVGAPERLPVQPAVAPRVVTAPTTTAVTPTPKASKFSFAQSQEAFSSISSAPGASAALPQAGVSRVSEGMSSASTFRDLGQTTGSSAPAAAQSVMQSAPGERAKTFFQ